MSDFPKPAPVPAKPTFPTVTTSSSPKPGSVPTPGLTASAPTYQTAPRTSSGNPKARKVG